MIAAASAALTVKAGVSAAGGKGRPEAGVRARWAELLCPRRRTAHDRHRPSVRLLVAGGGFEPPTKGL